MLMRSRAVNRSAGDDGIALPTVLLTMLLLTAFALTALAFVVQSTPANRTTADTKGALAAAQAGVDEYTSRLNGKPTYYTSVDLTNPAFTLQTDNTTKIDDGRNPLGASVPGTTDAFFRYVVLTKPATTARDGLIRLRVTGTADGETKSLTASYGVEGYLRFLYFTDVEALDPLLQVGKQSAANRDAYLFHCSQRWFDDTRGRGRWNNEFTYQGKNYNLGCTDIQFSGADVIDGPLHTNDAILMGGNATFNDPKGIVETGWGPKNNPPASLTKPWRGTGTPRGTVPISAGNVPIVKSNVKLLAQAKVPGGGCEYSGETSLEFDGDAVTVLSPGTTSTTSSACLDVSRRDQKQTIKIPPVIYVKAGTACGAVRLTYLSVDKGASRGGTTTTDDCTAGNAFVSGTISGQATVASENDVVITGDLKYAGGLTGDDVLGLIPNNYVWVYHPIKADGSEAVPSNKRVRRIDAAILSLTRSFLVQNWDLGSTDSPTLTVNGVIAQKFRGPVGQSSGTGYTKNYIYDKRLQNLPPPYFLTPEEAPWTVKRLTDG